MQFMRTITQALSRRLGRRFVVFLVSAGIIMASWLARHTILVGAARMLVNEDPLGCAEIIVASNSLPQATALEAAQLYNQHVSARIVMAGWAHNPLVPTVRRLGIPSLDTTEMNLAILERSGVPSAAITVLPGQVDGTETEVAAIAAFVDRRHLASVLVVTARSHTARTKWLLQRTLRTKAQVFVRSPRSDSFSVGQWWLEREHSREVVTEFLRWLHTLTLLSL